MTPLHWFLVLLSAILALRIWRRYRERQLELASPLAEHRLGMKYIGEVVVLKRPVRDGIGQIEIGKRVWEVRGPDLPEGARARVIGVDGSVLLLDRVAA
ncbi:MAG TPA: NfeD family protein [Steroidobacteraceae bacterium]|nr:NfeD family protein [Steroidobacteraceae bacterium]